MTGYAVTYTGKTFLSESLIYRKIIDLILNSQELRNAKLFCFDHYTPIAPGIVPYLKRNKISLYDNHGNDRSSFENIKNIPKYKYRAFNPTDFVNHLAKDRDNYFLAKSNRIHDYQDFSVKDENYIIYFDVIKKHPEMYFILFKIRAEKIK